MKKYKLTITHSYIKSLCNWLQHLELPKATTAAHYYEQKAIMTLLLKWIRSEQVRNLYDFPFQGPKKITLKPELAAALAAAIAQSEFEDSDYLGNYLRITLGQIDQHFK